MTPVFSRRAIGSCLLSLGLVGFAGCGGGSGPKYAARPTSACFRNHGVRLSGVSSNPGYAGGVGFKVANYTGGVFFFASHAAAKKAYSFVSNNIALSVHNTPPARRRSARLNPATSCSGNTIVSRTKFVLATRLRNLVGSCLRT